MWLFYIIAVHCGDRGVQSDRHGGTDDRAWKSGVGLLPRRHRASELGVGLDGLKESFRCVGNNCARSSDAASGEKKELWLAAGRSAMFWSNGRVSAGGGGRVAASFPSR